jgi:endonuclease V-like protein UPF0215 family
MAKRINKEKANEILHGTSTNGEPQIDSNNYNHSLSSALNYYNVKYSNADYKRFALEYAASIGLKLNAGIAEYMFQSIGSVCRLISRGCYIRAEDIQRTLVKLNLIQAEYEKSRTVESLDFKVAPVVKKENLKLISFENKIEDDLIQAILDSKNPLTVEALISNYVGEEFSKSDTKDIIKFIEDKIKYYNTAIVDKKGSDEDLKEAWQHIPSTRLKTAVKSLESLLEGINKSQVKVVAAKVVSKKEASPIIQVKKVPYLKEYNGINGLHPKDVIGKSVAFIFDTDTRDLIMLKCLAGKFKASGQSFTNVCDTNSAKKKLRHPEIQLNEFQGSLEKSKKADEQYFDKIKCKEQKAVGRMSDKRIILCVY